MWKQKYVCETELVRIPKWTIFSRKTSSDVKEDAIFVFLTNESDLWSDKCLEFMNYISSL